MNDSTIKKREQIEELSEHGNEHKSECSSIMPLISVIIPVFNGDNSLEAAIKSVINQQYKNIELIIIDGKSNDGTVETIRKYEDFIDYWVSECDEGVYDAMNKGVKVSHGDWIYFMGADDVLLNTLHCIAPYFKDKNRIYYGDVYMPSSHKLHGGKYNAKRLSTKNIPHQAIFYPKKVFNKYLYDTKYRIKADYHLNIRCYGDKGFCFEYLPILIAIFDDNGISSKCRDIPFERDFIDLLIEHMSHQLSYNYLQRKKLKVVTRKVKRNIKNRFKSILGLS